MEILSPAGNIEHVKVAIEEKADAVYGGLKNWNARNKAMNFSIDEYNISVKELHKNNMKFYMTLNILLFDNEINNIMDFLKNHKNELPDAFIVADIGLIQELKDNFPNIPIHLSTQFGIHCLGDIKLAEYIGAERAILARELTLDEVKKIKENTKLEIENFVWGSQCISFSGLCFFGSLINCGNGNRGKCIITCRDVYRVENNEGHFLYVPDLNCTQKIEELKNENIDCIKIEGRRRNSNEIKKLLNELKSEEYNGKQNGYLYGTSKTENNLFEKINSRIKPVYKAFQIKNVSKYDVFFNYENNIPIDFADEIKENSYYVYSEYKNEFYFDKKNISLDLSIEDDEIKKILYINHNGEGKTLVTDCNSNKIKICIEDFVNDIKRINPKINLHKIKYIRNIENKYIISKKLYKDLLEYINTDNQIKSIEYKENRKFKIEKLYVEVNNSDYIEQLIKEPFVKIIFNMETVTEISNYIKVIDKYKDKIIYKLPMFNYKNENLDKLYTNLIDKEVMFTRPYQVVESNKYKFKKKYIDYTIYIWNKSSLNFFDKYKIDTYTASPELNYDTNLKIFGNTKIQYIVAGKLPLVYTRQCFRNLYKCEDCLKCREKNKIMYNIDKNIKFKIHCLKDYRIVLNDASMLNNMERFIINDNISFRYATSDQTIDEIIESINLFKKEDYFNVMKTNKIWKESYEGNIIESRC